MPTISAELRKVLLGLDYADSIQAAAITFVQDDGLHPERLCATDPAQDSPLLQPDTSTTDDHTSEIKPRTFNQWPWHVPG